MRKRMLALLGLVVFCMALAPAAWAEEQGESPTWWRYAGDSAYDTMGFITSAAWEDNAGGTVLVATGENYPDALAAAGIAGADEQAPAPILITNSKSLSEQTEGELSRINPTNVIIVGGEFAITPAVEQQIKNALPNATVNRYSGNTAPETAAFLNDLFSTSWHGVAFVATPLSFQDALSAAPLSYALHIPIFLVKDMDTVTDDTVERMKSCGIEEVIALGGMYCVSDKAKAKLEEAGMPVTLTLAGDTAYDTSLAIAKWGVSQGMLPNMGLATGKNYPDALTGAAMCGATNSVLLLADAGKTGQAHEFFAANKSQIEWAFIFGGRFAVTYETLAKVAHGAHGFRTLSDAGVSGATVTDAQLDRELYNMEGILLQIAYNEPLDAQTPYYKCVFAMNYVGATYGYDNAGEGHYTAADMLKHGNGTCKAYSELTYLLLKKLGVTCWQTVSGRHILEHEPSASYVGSDHQSVVALVDGKYYQVDSNHANTQIQLQSMLGVDADVPPAEITEAYAKWLIGQSDTRPGGSN